VKLIIQPEDGIAPILAAIKNAKKSVEIAIFRFDRKDVEAALKSAAASKGVTVTALIAFANRGGEVRLRNLEQRFLDAGIIVARTADDLIRYHNKYILIDRRTLYVLSFNFTHLDIDHSRGFGIVTTHAVWISEAMRLFKADSARTLYTAKNDTFVVSPSNSRKVLEAFLKKAKKQLLIYDPRISDKTMLRILQERAKAGVEIKVIGSVAGRSPVEVQGLKKGRLHTRTIIRDGRQAFVGSQSLRPLELDARRELGLIVQDARTVKKLMDTFASDWDAEEEPKALPRKVKGVPSRKGRKREKAVKAVQVLTRELDPLATTVKQAVQKAVAKAGDQVLRDKDMKTTMKEVVKRAVKEAVKEAHGKGKD
jgi:phosphatidylserine/phosphatidylglycerophosphate/cardiolipin synthase-like enzyme